ncbi:dTMP kinase [Patescibacteria group bacterium]
MNKQKFITILGIDNSGKTTLCQSLKKTYPEADYVSWDSEDVPKNMKFLSELKLSFPYEEINSFNKNLRSHLLSTMIYAKKHIIETSLNKGASVICNSYYYKLLGKELILNQGNLSIYESWKDFIQPDLIIYLKISPQLSFKRSKKLNNFEYVGKKSKEGYIRFQKTLDQILQIHSSHLPIEFIDASKKEEAVLNQANKIIKKYLQ